MIHWDKYKPLMVKLYNDGLNSREILEELQKVHDEFKGTTSRSIRNAYDRWGMALSERTPCDEIELKPRKILLFDIETSPMIAYIWQLKQRGYINPSNIVQDWFVICWGAKWLFEDDIISGGVTPDEAINQDDKRIVSELWKLLNEADIVITHNGDKFDIKKMNGRFIKYGLNLPMPYRSIDTYKSARKRLNLSSLKLSFIAEYLGVSQKSDTDFQMWIDCIAGDKDQLDKMQKYCDQDVRVLEDVYLKLRPFIQPHPNLGLYIESDTTTCPSCASTKLNREGTYETTVNSYIAYRCQDCGSITRSRNTSLTKEDKKTITSSVPR